MRSADPLGILHVVCSDAFAGVERYVAVLAAQQAELGHQVHVIGGDPVAMREAIGHDEVEVTPAASLAQTARALVAARRRRPPHVVHAHMTAADLVAATLPLGAPLVSTRHFAARRGSSELARAVARLAATRVAAQIAISRYVAERVEGHSTVVRSGVRTQPDAAPGVDREAVILVAQRLEAEKATTLAVESFAASGVWREGWRLDVAGEGSERPVLERLARTLGVQPYVRFLGHRSDVEALMARSAMLLATCPTEGLGLAVIEAMAAGLPVVAAGAGGHLETVGAVEDAALFRPSDVGDAGQLLADLARDLGRRDRYGRDLQALQRREFTLEAQTLATDAVYRSVL